MAWRCLECRYSHERWTCARGPFPLPSGRRETRGVRTAPFATHRQGPHPPTFLRGSKVIARLLPPRAGVARGDRSGLRRPRGALTFAGGRWKYEAPYTNHRSYRLTRLKLSRSPHRSLTRRLFVRLHSGPLFLSPFSYYTPLAPFLPYTGMSYLFSAQDPLLAILTVCVLLSFFIRAIIPFALSRLFSFSDESKRNTTPTPYNISLLLVLLLSCWHCCLRFLTSLFFFSLFAIIHTCLVFSLLDILRSVILGGMFFIFQYFYISFALHYGILKTWETSDVICVRLCRKISLLLKFDPVLHKGRLVNSTL